MTAKTKTKAIRAYTQGRACAVCGGKKFLVCGQGGADLVGSAGHDAFILCRACHTTYEVVFSPWGLTGAPSFSLEPGPIIGV